MRFNLIFLLLVLFISPAIAQSTKVKDQKTDTILSSVAQQFVGVNPGRAFSVGVINKGHTYLFNYGSVTKNANQTPSNQTLYEIGSITKTFTSIILAHAVLEKKVKPTDDIRKYIPGKYPNLSYAGKPIQLIQLVNLTSGLPNNLPDHPDAFKNVSSDSVAYVFIKLLNGYTRSKFMEDLHEVKLDTIPGLSPKHSNAAALLLTYILENVYQKSLAQLLQQYITGPLKMDHTFLIVPDDKMPLLARGYTGKGLLMPYFPANKDVSFLKSSIADMTRYIQYQLDEKDPVVKLTHQVAWGNINGTALGWNWFMGKTWDGKMKINDDGTTFGFTAEILLYPEQKFGAVLLTNEYDQNSNNRLGQIAEKIFDESNYNTAERSSLSFRFSASINRLLVEVTKFGFTHAIEVAEDLKNNDPQFSLRENEVNAWGYSLLAKGKKSEALEIFKLNVSLYPESGNAFDSLGEIYADLGNKELAIKNYKRSLEINPKNDNAVTQLKNLQ